MKRLPPQLSRRVASGAITSQQAKRTARQRQTLRAAYGPDWRTKVFGRGGAERISGAFARPDVTAKRSQALTGARAKLSKRGRIAPAKKARKSAVIPNEGREYLRG